MQKSGTVTIVLTSSDLVSHYNIITVKAILVALLYSTPMQKWNYKNTEKIKLKGISRGQASVICSRKVQL